MKFWKLQWIDEVATILQNHEIDIGLNIWTPMMIANEKTIMDYAWDCTDKINEVRMINKVRICKNAIFLFEALGSNSHEFAEAFYNLKAKSQCDAKN